MHNQDSVFLQSINYTLMLATNTNGCFYIIRNVDGATTTLFTNGVIMSRFEDHYKLSEKEFDNYCEMCQFTHSIKSYNLVG